MWNVDHEVVGSNSHVAVEVAAELPLFDSAATASRFSPTNLGVNNELSVLAVGLECGRVSVWVGEGARWQFAVAVSPADAHGAAVRAIAWPPPSRPADAAVAGRLLLPSRRSASLSALCRL